MILTLLHTSDLKLIGLVPSYNNDLGGPLMSRISRLIVRSFDCALFHSGSPFFFLCVEVLPPEFTSGHPDGFGLGL